jgi:SET domain-containing protein
MKLLVKKSSLHGNGLFAAEEIPWGVKIIEYKGELVSDAIAEERIAQGADCIFELRDNENIDGAVMGNDARYVNHARQLPNCFVLREDDRIWIVAGIEGIRKGEELTFDYGSAFYPPQTSCRRGRRR